jgi:hypothetical protein
MITIHIIVVIAEDGEKTGAVIRNAITAIRGR